MNYIFGEDNWKVAYQKQENRQKTWIYIKFSDGKVIFLDEYSKWLSIEEYCNKSLTTMVELGLQYRTHRIVENVEHYKSVYLVRSLKADFGAPPKQCYTIGRVEGDMIHKKTWILPELAFGFSSVDPVETSFEEAIVNNDKTKTKSVQ